MFEINKIVKFLEMRKIFNSPLANHFSAVMQALDSGFSEMLAVAVTI
jgi:predicted membrane-bound dolichyl-phosphate-mannose-protein mannosyltransferase